MSLDSDSGFNVMIQSLYDTRSTQRIANDEGNCECSESKNICFRTDIKITGLAYKRHLQSKYDVTKLMFWARIKTKHEQIFGF